MLHAVAKHQSADVVILANQDAALVGCLPKDRPIARIVWPFRRVDNVMPIRAQRTHRGYGDVRICKKPQRLFGWDYRRVGDTGGVEQTRIDVCVLQNRIGLKDLAARSAGSEHF